MYDFVIHNLLSIYESCQLIPWMESQSRKVGIVILLILWWELKWPSTVIFSKSQIRNEYTVSLHFIHCVGAPLWSNLQLIIANTITLSVYNYDWSKVSYPNHHRKYHLKSESITFIHATTWKDSNVRPQDETDGIV